MIRVLIVDDQELVRRGLRNIIDEHAELEVVAEAGDGITALDHLQKLDIDVVLLDLRMPGIDGVETTRRIRSVGSPSFPRILILTTFDEDANVITAIRAGADGFFSKGASPSELTDGILRVAEGDRALSSTALNAVVGHVGRAPEEQPVDPELRDRFTALTDRERQVTALIVEGLSNAEIAERMFISPFTVKTHASRAMMKVDARDRAHLVSLAVKVHLNASDPREGER